MADKRILKVCDGKVKYASEDAALTKISLYKKEGKQMAYQCHFCKEFHIATVPNTKKRFIRKASPFKEHLDEPKMKNKPRRRRKNR